MQRIRYATEERNFLKIKKSALNVISVTPGNAHMNFALFCTLLANKAGSSQNWFLLEIIQRIIA